MQNLKAHRHPALWGPKCSHSWGVTNDISGQPEVLRGAARFPYETQWSLGTCGSSRLLCARPSELKAAGKTTGAESPDSPPTSHLRLLLNLSLPEKPRVVSQVDN